MKTFFTLAVVALCAAKANAQRLDLSLRGLDTNHVWHQPVTPDSLFKNEVVAVMFGPAVITVHTTMPVKHLTSAEPMPVAHLSSGDKIAKKVVVEQTLNK